MVVQTPKISLEIKQTAKGVFYIGSLKINADNLEEIDLLFDQALQQARSKILSANSGETEKITKISNREDNLKLDSDFDVELFDFLKNLRLEISRNQKVPPYVVFHDSVLMQFAKNKPMTKSDMLKINGVGDKNYEKYGDIFLKSIQHFLSEREEQL